MAEFDQYGHDYRERLDRSVKGVASVDSALNSKIRLLRRLVSNLPGVTGGNALDFGCGAGLLTDSLKSLSQYTFGVDISLESLRHAHASESQLAMFDGDRLPFRDGSFGLVVASCVFHHIPPARRPAIAGEIARVVAPGGLFVIIEHNPYNPVTRWVVNRCEFDQDAELLSMKQARSLIDQAGLGSFQDEYFYAIPPVNDVLAGLDRLLSRLPVGAQYCCAGRKGGRE